MFFRIFVPSPRTEAGNSDVVAYRLGNLAAQVQKVVVEERFATDYSRQCANLLEDLHNLGAVFVGMMTSLGGDFLSLCRQLLITSNTSYYMCVNFSQSSVMYCWPANGSQSAILELFERFHAIRDTASKGKWELLPMAIFEGDDVADWYARLKDTAWLARVYGLRVSKEKVGATAEVLRLEEITSSESRSERW